MTDLLMPSDRLDIEGPAAPPRRNGELVFEEPWESRAFGMAVALSENGAFAWDAFRTHLIGELATWRTGEPFSYYEYWLRAFERLLVERGHVYGAEIDARVDVTREADHHG
jgi:nitrile hydratase accessory protein